MTDEPGPRSESEPTQVLEAIAEYLSRIANALERIADAVDEESGEGTLHQYEPPRQVLGRGRRRA